MVPFYIYFHRFSGLVNFPLVALVGNFRHLGQLDLARSLWPTGLGLHGRLDLAWSLWPTGLGLHGWLGLARSLWLTGLGQHGRLDLAWSSGL